MFHAALDLAPHGVLAVEEAGESSVTMKNWLLALFGSCERAIEATPRLCDSAENSALRLGRSDP